MVSTLATFGASVSGVSLQSSSAARVAQRPAVVSVEAAARRNLKKEKRQRNRNRTNELKRLSGKSTVQKTFYRREEDTAKLPDDYLSPFSYDSRGEPVEKEVEEEPMVRMGRTWIN